MQCMHASVHMFIEFVCVRVFKGKTKNVPNLYSLDGPLFMYPLRCGTRKMFMYPPRSTSYYVVCLLDGRRVVLVQTQQHRETAALMKRKEVCKLTTPLLAACLPYNYKQQHLPVPASAKAWRYSRWRGENFPHWEACRCQASKFMMSARETCLFGLGPRHHQRAFWPPPFLLLACCHLLWFLSSAQVKTRTCRRSPNY